MDASPLASRSEDSPESASGRSPEGGPAGGEDWQEKLAESERLASEYLDGWQRSRAEFANYKSRVRREELEAQAQATATVLARTLPILDDLERALKDRPREGEAAVWADGLELIFRKWLSLLEAAGVEPILAEGLHFDPTLHEALSHEESPDHGEGEVIQVITQGYRLGDRVLRPALVRVAK
ncbi:MAG: nucleotide exchange factor GrpE [Anaerolineales bacterium]